MSRIRRGPLVAVLLPAALSAALLVAGADVPAGAAAVSRHGSHVTARASATARAVVTATVRATAGNPAVTASGRATAAARARASARITLVVRSLASSGPARARALKAAFAAARRRATARARVLARALARRRAAAAARTTARSRAVAAAKQRSALLAAQAATTTVPSSGGNRPCGGTTLVKSAGQAWVCTFDDEFNGTALDRSVWSSAGTAQTGLTAGGGCFVDSPANIAVGGGVLSLTVRKEAAPFTCHSPTGDFSTQVSAAQIATTGRFAQTYGRFAVRAKFPSTTIAGLQSSLWMWPQNNVATGLTGEIDIAEEYSQYADRAIPYLHYPYDPSTTNTSAGVNVPTNTDCLIGDVNAFHEYAVEWTPGTIRILFDGRTCLTDHYVTLGSSPFEQPFFLALSASLGIGSNAYQAGRTPLPATTQIDWVRAWK